MLTLRIDPVDLAQPWRWNGSRYVAGSSWIAPFQHPALEHELRRSGAETTLVVRERHRNLDGHQHSDIDAWSGAAMSVLTTLAGEVRLRAGSSVVAPIYATVDADGVLHASWDLTDTARHAPTNRLHEVEVCRLLALWLRYTPATLFDDVVRLTERACLVLKDGQLTTVLPADSDDHYAPRTVRPDADVISAFETLLDNAISARVYDPTSVVVEVSGGADSAQVALSLAARHPGELTAAGMLIPGVPGAQQRRRRDAFIAGRFARDVTIDAVAPLTPGGLRASGITTSPYEDAYTEATTAMLYAATGGRPATVWTGIGGDEMLALSAQERTPRPIGHGYPINPWLSDRTAATLRDLGDSDLPPVSAVNEMTLLQFGYRAPIMLRMGCWPINILADPTLARFGEWLPTDWRRLKRLARARLERAGFPPDVVTPAQPENFRDVMREAVVSHVVPRLRQMLADGGTLLDEGYLNPDGLTVTLNRIQAGGYAKRDDELFDLVAVEQAATADTRIAS